MESAWTLNETCRFRVQTPEQFDKTTDEKPNQCERKVSFNCKSSHKLGTGWELCWPSHLFAIDQLQHLNFFISLLSDNDKQMTIYVAPEPERAIFVQDWRTTYI